MVRKVFVLILMGMLLPGCAVHQKAATPMDARVPGSDDEAGAIAANILYMPGHGLVCGMSAVISGVAMLATFGYAYESASQLMHGGCSGPWGLRANDIREAVQ